MFKTKRDAIRELHECDHGYLTVEGAKMFTDAFGVRAAPTERQRANTGEFKGLEVPNVPAGAEVEGVSAHLLAEHIAAELDLPTPEQHRYIEGRGSRLRAALSRIEDGIKSGDIAATIVHRKVSRAPAK